MDELAEAPLGRSEQRLILVVEFAECASVRLARIVGHVQGHGQRRQHPALALIGGDAGTGANGRRDRRLGGFGQHLLGQQRPGQLLELCRGHALLRQEQLIGLVGEFPAGPLEGLVAAHRVRHHLVRGRDAEGVQLLREGGVTDKPRHDALVDPGRAHGVVGDEFARLAGQPRLLACERIGKPLRGHFRIAHLRHPVVQAEREDVADAPDREADHQHGNQDPGGQGLHTLAQGVQHVVLVLGTDCPRFLIRAPQAHKPQVRV